jgi:diguanylate cyclase (GGDEF)-like protein
MEKEHILIIEINEKNLTVLKTLLEKEGYSLEGVVDGDSFLKITKEQKSFDMILVNAHTKYITAEDIKKLTDIESVYDGVPVVYIDSAKEYDKAMLEKAFDLGATDYIKKPFDSKEILARIQHHLQVDRKLREYKLRVDKLANLATIDQLSKSTSKMHMQAILKHELNNFKRYDKDSALIYLGVSNIEKYISAFGLERGERHITNFAKFLRDNIRESDALARWVGSEFLVLLTNTNIKIAELVARKIKTALSNDEKLSQEQLELAFGITELQGDDTLEEAVERVKYLYNEAKKQTYGKLKVA